MAGTTQYLVSFPALGGGLPRNLTPRVEAGRRLRRNLPHWFYGLEALPPWHPAPPQRFTPAGEGWLRSLLDCLGLPGQGYEVRPRELYHGHHLSHCCSDLAFPIPLRFKGRSFSLAVAVNLLATHCGLPVPPWVTFSGCLPEEPDEQLRLQTTGRIVDKVRLCLGREPAFDTRHLTDLLYQHETSEAILGPRTVRTVSGEVKVLLVPTDLDGWDSVARDRLGAEGFPFPLDQLDHGDPVAFRRSVEALGDGEFLMVQVPTVWHACAFLGHHRRHTRAADRLARLGGEELFAWRIPRERRARIRNESDFRERKAQEALSELAPKLADIPSFHGRLQAILHLCVDKLGCVGGIIALRSEDPEWLEVYPWGGQPMRAFPRFIPAREGLPGLVLETGRRRMAESPEDWRALCSERPPTDLLQRRFKPEVCRQFAGLLGSFRAAVGFPLGHRGQQPLGALCLFRAEPGRFDPDGLHVVSRLAERAREEILLSQQKTWDVGRPGDARRIREAVERAGQKPLAEACRALGDDLARHALDLSGATRACVRWLSHDGQSLAVTGLAGPWPDGFQERVFSRTERNACNYALNWRMHYRVADTRETSAVLEVVGEFPAAHMAVIVWLNAQPVGVLSVDFDEEHRGACNAQTERDLEELTAHYAVHLHAFSKERLHDRLDSSLAPLVGDPEQPAVVLPIAEDPTEDVEKLQNWLMLLGQSLGVERGALFLRDKEYGDYRLRSELPGWDRLPEDCRYKPGDGRTGWVALNKKPLRINDCSNLREMARIKPRLTQSTHPPCWDRDSERLAYLGVPVLVGGDVLGVLRFVCRSPRAPGERRQWTGKEHFTALDQQLAEAAAARLGGWLYKRLELDRIIALRRLAHEILKARSREELCRTIHDVLERGIGRCRVVLRLADRRSRDGGRPERALDRVFVSDGSHDSWPAFRTQQEEVAIQVWTEGRRYVSQDVSEDPNLGWPRELAGSLVISPLKADRNTCGTLAVHRAHPHALLQSDLDFVEKVTELAGLAFKRLGEVEEHRIQENLLWAVLEHFRQHLGAEDGRAGWYLLRKITKVVKDGLGASARYVWTGDEEAGRLTTFQAEVRPVAWSADVPRPGPGPGPTAGRVVVVTEPETDRRLLSLQKALHPRDRAGYADRQRAAIVLPPAEHLNLYQPSVLLFVVDPPHRLSHLRVERVFRMLSETLFRLWPRS